ncbi:ABC transporter ATP-binding protein [Proteinivorax tanatarense]|uniref:ABC transporter ATP-binding protein n=1 Tax=Proteinivorax tanatarense TaxID=1260629 RepID=A0AAU7VPS7_9FIRM
MVLQCQDVVKRYKESLALDNVSLNIKEGSIFGLLGPNGAGKTSLINCIVGLIQKDKGSIYVFGSDLSKNGIGIKKKIGIVPQEIAVYRDLTAYENVAFFAKLYEVDKREIKARVEEALEFVGLLDKKDQFSKTFSGGMMRRLNIACAIAHSPRLIIMDEPTVGIDPQSRELILQSVKTLNKRGSTVIYTSHYMEEVEKICDDIAIMDHGRVIARGSKEELIASIEFQQVVEIKVDKVTEELLTNLRDVQGVLEANEEKGKITVTCSKNNDLVSKIIEAVTNSGGKVTALSVEKPNLEGVFLTLTGRSLRD